MTTIQPMENGLFTRVLRTDEFLKIEQESKCVKVDPLNCSCADFKDGRLRVFRVFGRIMGDGSGSPIKIKYKNQIARCSHYAAFRCKPTDRSPKSIDVAFMRFSKIQTRGIK